MALSRLHSIVFDCAHPTALARFWAAALGYTVRPYSQAEVDRLAALGYTVEDDPSVVIDPPGEGPTIWFTRVPEAKVVKNRVHLDVDLDSGAAVDALVSLGATVIRRPSDGGASGHGDVYWFVMADPEGNEFCAFPPKT